jgi:hypothetical protein
MIKPSSQTNKLLATMTITMFIFLAFIISGFTVAGFEAEAGPDLPPSQGPDAQPARNLRGLPDAQSVDNTAGRPAARPNIGGDEPDGVDQAAQPAFQLTNVIKNGDFEKNPRAAVATYWEPFNNGGAIYGWYAEEWEEAVHSGRRSQLLEINYVEGYQPNRIIAIYQTVDVVPNAFYNLTIHALMRSDAPIEDRNMGDYKMEWGIDYRGSGKHNNVLIWHTMPLSEQLRIGSNGFHSHDRQRLYFQRIFTTVHTADSSRITLFIRGLKVEPTGTEVNFNIDDVSLIGPYFPPAPTPATEEEEVIPLPDEEITPTQTVSPTATPTDRDRFEIIPSSARIADDNSAGNELAAPANIEDHLPSSGAVRPRRISLGALVLGGLILVILGASAANGLLNRPKTPK